MPEYEVEFWPRTIVKVTADDEYDAVCLALHEREYPGSLECTRDGERGMFWVREIKEEKE